MTDTNRNNWRTARRLGLAVVLAFTVGLTSACEGLLDVEMPGQLTEQDLLQPEMAQTMVTSAVAQYECGYSEFAAAIGGMEDAFWESTGWFTRAWAEYRPQGDNGALDSNECGPSDTSNGFFADMQGGRFQAEQAYEKIQEFEDISNEARLLAESATWAGYAYTTFGEHWCEMAANVGPLMTPEETLQKGEEWFTKAIQQLGTSGDFATENTQSMQQLAHLGRARVRYALGDYSGAAEDARQITEGFTGWITRSGAVRKRWNQVHQHLTVSKFGTVPPPIVFQGDSVPFTGYRHLTITEDGRAVREDGLPVRKQGVDDPRVPVENTGQIGQDGVTPHWIQTKYTSHADNIPLAKWEEAQLILAEIEGGQEAIDRVNAIRAHHGLPEVTYLDPSDSEGIQRMILEERRRTFFFEGRWHADKLRNDLFFPEGQGFNHKGVAYGPTTCLPLSETEKQSNPNIESG